MGNVCVFQTMDKDKSAAMLSLDNRQTRHVGSILAKCQSAKGHNKKQKQNVAD